jgi:hypothetical protein
MKYTREILEPLVRESVSIAEVCRKLGVADNGGSVSHVARCITKFGINKDHFTGRAHNRGKKNGFSYPLEDYLSNKRPIHSHCLKNRLISEGILPKQCSCCKLTHWLGREMSLELHHLDGDHNNNSLSNLRIVCPNCHWTAHDIINQERKQAKIKEKGPDKRGHAKPYLRKQQRPEYDILLKEIEDLGYCGTARKYGVSDNAIRKWIRIYQKYGK